MGHIFGLGNNNFVSYCKILSPAVRYKIPCIFQIKTPMSDRPSAQLCKAGIRVQSGTLLLK